jgi:hypothetical protein
MPDRRILAPLRRSWSNAAPPQHDAVWTWLLGAEPRGRRACGNQTQPTQARRCHYRTTIRNSENVRIQPNNSKSTGNVRKKRDIAGHARHTGAQNSPRSTHPRRRIRPFRLARNAAHQRPVRAGSNRNGVSSWDIPTRIATFYSKIPDSGVFCWDTPKHDTATTSVPRNHPLTRHTPARPCRPPAIRDTHELPRAPGARVRPGKQAPLSIQRRPLASNRPPAGMERGRG